MADQVGPRNMAPDSLGGIEPDALPPEGGSSLDDMLGNDPVLDDLLLMVNVVEEQVESGDPLIEPSFERVPFTRPKHPRHDIEGNDPLGAFAVPVDVEGDSQTQH